MFTLSRNEAWGHSCVHTPWVPIGARHRQCWALCPAAHRPREISRLQNKTMAQQRGSEPRIPSSTPYPIPIPTQTTQGLCPLGASQKLKSQTGDDTCQLELLLGTPSEDRKILQTSSKASCRTLLRPTQDIPAASRSFLSTRSVRRQSKPWAPTTPCSRSFLGMGSSEFHCSTSQLEAKGSLKGCREPLRSYSMHS